MPKKKKTRTPNKVAWLWYGNIISNLNGWKQVYRFLDRLESVKTSSMTFKAQMDAFLERYPQYNTKKGKVKK